MSATIWSRMSSGAGGAASRTLRRALELPWTVAAIRVALSAISMPTLAMVGSTAPMNCRLSGRLHGTIDVGGPDCCAVVS